MPKSGSSEQTFADVIRRKATQLQTSKALQSNSVEERFAARVAAITKDKATAPLRSAARGRRKPV